MQKLWLYTCLAVRNVLCLTDEKKKEEEEEKKKKKNNNKNLAIYNLYRHTALIYILT